MPKRIAIFCDGTWSTRDEEVKRAKKQIPETNVAFLYEACMDVKAGPDGLVQESGYFSGVGVERNPILGGTTGKGLDLKIQEAYEWLSSRYQFGDEVFLFGFSRGAYTVRSLGGLIRTCGFLRAPSPKLAQKAMDLYRKRGKADGPDYKAARQFREKEASAWVENGPLNRPILIQEGRTATLPYAVRHIGVWDTVGALGVPEGFPLDGFINKRFRFHDTSLSRMVYSARHALAADERRIAFAPSPWSNVEELNQGLPEKRYEQAWFPGDHGSVGGGGFEIRLSSTGLLWIAEGAIKQGLGVDMQHPHMVRAKAEADPVNGPLTNVEKSNPFEELLFKLADRPAALDCDFVHDAANLRMTSVKQYRPAPLKRYWPAA